MCGICRPVVVVHVLVLVLMPVLVHVHVLVLVFVHVLVYTLPDSSLFTQSLMNPPAPPAAFAYYVIKLIVLAVMRQFNEALATAKTACQWIESLGTFVHTFFPHAYCICA